MLKSIKKHCYFLGFLTAFLLLINFNLISVAASTAKWVVDGASIYVSVLDDNIILPSGSISASPNPCAIVSPSTVCNSSISWQTTNAPNACIFLKESNKLFACGPSGNSNASWVDINGVTFELREKNDINSRILASVFVKGEIQTARLLTLGVFITGAGSGSIAAQGINCQTDCQESYLKGTSITLIATPDSGSRFINWSGDCSGTNPTCGLIMNNNKSVIANFETVATSQSFCSTGSIRACIDSVSPNPAGKGQNITFTSHGENDNNKPITAYRWRLDSISGKTLISRESTFSTNAISSGTHTIYFRVSVGKTFGGWSDWISREFTVESGTTASVCGNNICESGETHLNCSQDCFVPPKPQCSDGADNDNDGKIDYPADTGCFSSTDNDEKDAPPPINIPVAPTDLTVTLGKKPSPNTRELLLRWKDMSSNEGRFELEWRFTKGSFFSERHKVDLPANQPFYTFRASDEKGRTHYFRIRACNIAGCSDYTEENSYAF